MPTLETEDIGSLGLIPETVEWLEIEVGLVEALVDIYHFSLQLLERLQPALVYVV